jgi:hypothetical protein
MPQCMCGNFFSTTTYTDEKEDDLCPRCKDASTPASYTSSYQWTCENTSNLLLDANFSSGGGNSDG